MQPTHTVLQYLYFISTIAFDTIVERISKIFMRKTVVIEKSRDQYVDRLCNCQKFLILVSQSYQKQS